MPLTATGTIVTDDASLSLAAASASKAEGISDLGRGRGVLLVSEGATGRATLAAAFGSAGWNVSN